MSTCVIYIDDVWCLFFGWRIDDIRRGRRSGQTNKQFLMSRQGENDDVCQTLNQKIYYHLRLSDVIDNLPFDILLFTELFNDTWSSLSFLFLACLLFLLNVALLTFFINCQVVLHKNIFVTLSFHNTRPREFFDETIFALLSLTIWGASIGRHK